MKCISNICFLITITLSLIVFLADYEFIVIDNRMYRILDNTVRIFFLVGAGLRFYWKKLKNGDFKLSKIQSDYDMYDARYKKISKSSDEWTWGIEIRSLESYEPIFRYPFNKAEKNTFNGICWEPGSYNLWVRLDKKTVFCLCKTFDSWVRDDSLPLPETIALEYTWYGTVKNQ